MIYFAGMLGDWLSSSVGNGVPGILDIGIRSLAFSIATFIYQLIISFYNIFEKLCSGRFFDSDMLKSFSERVGVVLGVVMLFIAIFSMIKMVVDPDKITDKEMGATALIKKTVIVMVMLGVSNFAFSFLYKVQDVVLEEDIISKILLPIRVDESNSTSFGNILSEELFMSFYKMEDNIDSSENVAYCENVMDQFRDQIITSGNFNLGRECLSESVKVQSGGGTIETFLINYNWLLSLIAGVAVAYLIFSYCISVGIRMIQLLFLEIISPMAIISYLIPKKDTMFGKWVKIYIATYIDVFIRVAIIDFIVFIIAAIFSSEFSFSFIPSTPSAERSLMVVIIIIALLTFAKKAPDLLKDLFPASASKLGLGVNSPKKILDGMLGGNAIRTGAKVATVGAAIGAIGAFNSARSRYKMNMKDVDKDDPVKVAEARKKALRGAAGGAFAAYGRGLVAGANSKGNVFKSVGEGLNKQRTIDDKYDQLITSGGSVSGKLGSKITSYYGETKGQEFTRKIKNNQDFVDAYNKIDDLGESFLEVKIAKGLWQNAQARGEDDRTIQMLFDNYKRTKQAMTSSAIKGKNDFSYEVEVKDMIYEKDDKGNLLLDENGKAIIKTDEFGNQMYQINKVAKTGKMDVKSLAVASQVQVNFSDIENLVSTGRVSLSYENKEGKTINVDTDYLKQLVKDSKLNAADALDKATAAAAKKISDIKSTEGYSAAIANDKAAGVDSNATANKK